MSDQNSYGILLKIIYLKQQIVERNSPEDGERDGIEAGLQEMSFLK
ncbi:MAG: hypothetical protein WAO19_01340 [Candidatus Kryptoniota bacterium]